MSPIGNAPHNKALHRTAILLRFITAGERGRYQDTKELKMDMLIVISYILFFIMGLFLSFQSFKYFKTMWDYKHRKKDGSEDDQFKKLD
jgi:hypothetical protein